MALALAVVAAGVGPSDAGPVKAKSKSSSKSSKSSSKSKKKSKYKPAANSPPVSKRVYDGMPPGFDWPVTRAMTEANKACEAKLDRAGQKWERAKALGRIANPINVTDGMIAGVKYTNWWGEKANTTMECQLVLALVTIAPELRALGVREVKYGQVYEWSYVRATYGRMLSRHAIGTAIDIGAFVDDSGREVKVSHAYKQKDNLLLALEQLFVASAHFHNVITPKNDPVGHDNHYHVEAVVDFRPPPPPPSKPVALLRY
jgi:hypothetical protein